MGLIEACSGAFAVFGQFFDCLPFALKLFIYAGVGLFLLFGILRLFIRGV